MAAAGSDPEGHRIARRVIVSGRVTGVGFRYATWREACRYPGLSGYVRNADESTVECVLLGDTTAVEAMVAWLQHGPPGARVLSHRASAIPAAGDHGEFRIRG